MNLTLKTPLIGKNNENSTSYKQLQLQTFYRSSSVLRQEELSQLEYAQSKRNLQEQEKKEKTFESCLLSIPTFNPDNFVIFMWRVFICLFCCLYFYLIPIFMFFGYYILSEDLELSSVKIVLWFLIVFLIFDCIITFNTGYYDKGLLVDNKKKIYYRYLTTQFPFDVVAMLAIFLQILFTQNDFLLLWFPYLFYCKIYFVVVMDLQILQILQLYRRTKAIYQTIRLILTILFIINLFACFFYGAGEFWITNKEIGQDIYSSWLIQSSAQNDIYELPKHIQYEYAFYWAVTTMLTVGYGDITGKNPIEIFISIITMIFACVVFALLISAFQDIFAEINQNNLKFEKKMTDINRFMKDKNIDDETQNKVRRFFVFMYSEKVRDFHEQILTINQLGPQLKDEVIMQSYGVLLRRIYWFSPFSIDLQKKLAYLITEQMYSNGEIIFYQDKNSYLGNNDDDSLYSIGIGGINLQLILDEEAELKILFDTLEKESLFGEITFLTGQQRTLTAITTSISRLYKLSRSDFLTVLQQFPNDYQTYCMIRDQLMFENYGAININCFNCRSQSHIANKCPKTHYSPNKRQLITQIMSLSNDRSQFKRSSIRKDNLNMLRIKLASQKVQLELQQGIESEDEMPTPLTARHLFDKSQSFDDSGSVIETDFITEIVNRLEQKKKQTIVEIDSVYNYKNYFPKYNILSLIKQQRKERRISRQFKYL